jgi:hypothetical protein
MIQSQKTCTFKGTVIALHKKGTYERDLVLHYKAIYTYTHLYTYLNISSLEAPCEYVLHGPLLAKY